MAHRGLRYRRGRWRGGHGGRCGGCGRACRPWRLGRLGRRGRRVVNELEPCQARGRFALDGARGALQPTRTRGRGLFGHQLQLEDVVHLLGRDGRDRGRRRRYDGRFAGELEHRYPGGVARPASGLQQHREALHDGTHRRGGHALHGVVPHRLAVGEDHGDAQESAHRRAHRQKQRVPAILESRLMAVDRGVGGEDLESLDDYAVLIGSERTFAQPQHVRFAVAQGHRVQAPRRQHLAQLLTE